MEEFSGKAVPEMASAHAAATPRSTSCPRSNRECLRVSPWPILPVATPAEVTAIRAGAGQVTLRSLAAGDAGWVVARHGVLYRREYGCDSRLEAYVARIVADYLSADEPTRQNAWIADRDGEPVGSIVCTSGGAAHGEHTAQLRLFLVEPSARGAGVGSQLVAECLRFATDAGYQRITLFTYDVMSAARRIYVRAGFTLASAAPDHTFGYAGTAERWNRDLPGRQWTSRYRDCSTASPRWAADDG